MIPQLTDTRHPARARQLCTAEAGQLIAESCFTPRHHRVRQRRSHDLDVALEDIPLADTSGLHYREATLTRAELVPNYLTFDQLYLRLFIAARRFCAGERTYLFW